MKRFRSVVLVNVEEPYASALARAAHQRGLTAIRTAAAPGVPRKEHPPSLVVVQASNAGHGSIEVMAALRKIWAEVPSVILSEGGRGRELPGLLGAAARDIVSMAASPAEVAEACLHHALWDDAVAASDLVGESPPMRDLRSAVAAAALVPTTVLLTGDTGTGKGVAARLLHRLSPRSARPFLHVDCAALAPTVIESELFGHERGAFTGAASARVGRFEQVGMGTIFLDEIGELSLELQAKFLRVLEERSFERVGGTATHRMQARVIAATNKDLDAEVQAGRFRRDLLYRLRVIHLPLPPLRERLEDVPLLVRAALERLCQELGRPKPAVGASFCERLREHEWPGNVRELLHVLEAVLIRTRSPKLERFHLERLLPDSDPTERLDPLPPRGSVATSPDPSEHPMSERDQLATLLMATGGNVARVARRAKMARSTVRYKIRRYGLAHLVPTD